MVAPEIIQVEPGDEIAPLFPKIDLVPNTEDLIPGEAFTVPAGGLAFEAMDLPSGLYYIAFQAQDLSEP